MVLTVVECFVLKSRVFWLVVSCERTCVIFRQSLANNGATFRRAAVKVYGLRVQTNVVTHARTHTARNIVRADGRVSAGGLPRAHE